MANLVGTYKLQSQENYKEYLISLGLNDEQATKLTSLSENTVISSVDDNAVTAEYGGKSLTFPLNKELEHTLSSGHKVLTTAKVSDNGITFNTKISPDGALTEEKVLKLVDGVLIVTSTNSKGVKAVRKFKKV